MQGVEGEGEICDLGCEGLAGFLGSGEVGTEAGEEVGECRVGVFGGGFAFWEVGRWPLWCNCGWNHSLDSRPVR